MMYLCNNCGAVFSSTRHYSSCAPGEMLPFAEWEGCPQCSSDDFDEAHCCSICGGYMTEGYKAVDDDDTYFCLECVKPWEAIR